MTEQLLAGENWGTEKGNEGTIFGWSRVQGTSL
jgi:hypothetical protein